jgi:hypothetical protein
MYGIASSPRITQKAEKHMKNKLNRMINIVLKQKLFFGFRFGFGLPNSTFI